MNESHVRAAVRDWLRPSEIRIEDLRANGVGRFVGRAIWHRAPHDPIEATIEIEGGQRRGWGVVLKTPAFTAHGSDPELLDGAALVAGGKFDTWAVSTSRKK